MHAFKSAQKRSARERRDEELRCQRTYDVIVLTLMLTFLSLNKRYSFGAKRLHLIFDDVFDTMQEYTNRYGSDGVITALHKHLSERGINLDIDGMKE